MKRKYIYFKSHRKDYFESNWSEKFVCLRLGLTGFYQNRLNKYKYKKCQLDSYPFCLLKMALIKSNYKTFKKGGISPEIN